MSTLLIKIEVCLPDAPGLVASVSPPALLLCLLHVPACSQSTHGQSDGPRITGNISDTQSVVMRHV